MDVQEVLKAMFDPKFKEKYEECRHCHGHGSSLKESSPKCTVCGGSGLIRKEETENGLQNN